MKFFQKTDPLVKAVKTVIKKNKEVVTDIYQGKATAKNFIKGQIIKLTKGAYTSSEVEAELNKTLRK